MDPDTDVCQTEQPQISYSVDFTAEQSSAMGSPILLGREGSAVCRTHSAYAVCIPYRLRLPTTSYQVQLLQLCLTGV